MRRLRTAIFGRTSLGELGIDVGISGCKLLRSRRRLRAVNLGRTFLSTRGLRARHIEKTFLGEFDMDIERVVRSLCTANLGKTLLDKLDIGVDMNGRGLRA